MVLSQNKGLKYPALIVSSNDLIIPPGGSQFVRIAIKAIREWEAVYVTPVGSFVDLFPVEVLAQVFSSQIYLPVNNRTTEPREIMAGTVICFVRPVESDNMGCIACAYSLGNKEF